MSRFGWSKYRRATGVWASAPKERRRGTSASVRRGYGAHCTIVGSCGLVQICYLVQTPLFSAFPWLTIASPASGHSISHPTLFCVYLTLWLPYIIAPAYVILPGSSWYWESGNIVPSWFDSISRISLITSKFICAIPY